MRPKSYLNISSPYFSSSSLRLRLKCREVRAVIGVAEGVPSDDSEPSDDMLRINVGFLASSALHPLRLEAIRAYDASKRLVDGRRAALDQFLHEVTESLFSNLAKGVMLGDGVDLHHLQDKGQSLATQHVQVVQAGDVEEVD